jgi:hypothetical protein
MMKTVKVSEILDLLCIGVEDCPRLYHFIGHGVFSCPEGQRDPPTERGQGNA